MKDGKKENQNKVIVSLDLSTITIGFCVMEATSGKLLELGYYSFISTEMLDKSMELKIFINLLEVKYPSIEKFIIEERLKSFRVSKTNANAMLKLAALNFCCQHIIFNKGYDIKEINVNSARKLAFDNFHSMARALVDTKQKEFAFQLVIKELGKDIFPSKINKSGKNKGKEVFLEEAKDMSDAWILGKAALKILNPKL